MTEQFHIFQIETDTEIPETLGTKEKFWITFEDKLCLLKFGREGTGEDWAEKITCELCSCLGLPHAHYELASFRNRGAVLSPSIVEDGGRLILGNELINRVSQTYDNARTYLQKEHTVSRVFAALAMFTRPDHKHTWRQFLGYLMFDAWIGNTDRHHENWGLIVTKSRSIYLAPTFDHASSLGRELTDERRRSRLDTKDSRANLKAFALKARSAIYADPSDPKPLSPIDAFSLAARLDREGGLEWLEKLEHITPEHVSNVINRVPATLMSSTAKEFAFKLLLTNQSSLLSLRKAKS
ncbi:phosphatidylinositol kinase [Agrobacterium tumefaciens]|uniref:HipA domain-containing protein n=1 Tax=Agrobacterium tumefaciens TaxID=358 RepID=UPI0021D008A3|nr:HipA domain-containing protein [Agrobacterium tumefaciens]UXS08208.1 phosphatidylinositol kinase [Agrobacterium tumefaciens]UXS15571.1 phosphatidylinositol kinase [Agrobacterium tumefaciens]UXT64240.1 phosphatidylinositol kinase [Agrobacterium tumefaciens]